MSEFKYTNDGKKVSVIGKINKAEFIVQEVFVTEGGDEIPSGENFTARSLHDSPVKSWKEKKIEEYERQYVRKENEIKDIQRELREMQKEKANHASIISSNLRQIKELENLDVDNLSDVMARNVKWACSDSYDWYKVMSFDEFIEIRSAYDEGIKLISVHVKKDNTLFYKVGSYSDGSGGSKPYKFFNCKEELSGFLENKYKKALEEDRLTVDILDHIKGYVDVPNNVRSSIIEKRIKEAELTYQKELERITKIRDKAYSLAKGE